MPGILAAEESEGDRAGGRTLPDPALVVGCGPRRWVEREREKARRPPLRPGVRLLGKLSVPATRALFIVFGCGILTLAAMALREASFAAPVGARCRVPRRPLGYVAAVLAQPVVVAAAVSLLLSVACTSGDSGEQDSPSGASTAAGSQAPSAALAGSEASEGSGGCTSRGAGAAAGSGAKTVEEGDFDGDGDNDQLLIGERTEVRVQFAAGGSSTVEVPTAKPFGVIGAQDVQRDGREEAFIEILQGEPGGRPGVFIAAVIGCELRLLQNVEGAPYMFIVGDKGETGDGLGCVDGQLVGLHYERDGARVAWERTAVQFAGEQLVNGDQTTGELRSPQDDDEIRLLSEATCYDDPLDNPYV